MYEIMNRACRFLLRANSIEGARVLVALLVVCSVLTVDERLKISKHRVYYDYYYYDDYYD